MGEIPRDVAALLKLPGVGPYTANAVAVFALDQPRPLVDWVIARVLTLYFGVTLEKRPNQAASTWDVARRLAVRGRASSLWWAVLDLAEDVCKPTPLCDECALQHLRTRRVENARPFRRGCSTAAVDQMQTRWPARNHQ